MRAQEFSNILLEYSRDATTRSYGPAIIRRMTTGPDERLFNTNMNVRTQPPELATVFTPYDNNKLLAIAFSRFEDGDPTFDAARNRGGTYVPWIAREYARGGIARLEDCSARVRPILELYHKYKRRGDFPAELRDIMRVNWRVLQNAMDEYQPEIMQTDRGESKTVYEDNTVRVIVPEDETAACYYGQGTRWCTAATRGTNYFEQYSKRGPLYILLPKKPEYDGERYQLHFPSQQYMNEEDEPENIVGLLRVRFPGLEDFFKKQVPDIWDMIGFMDNTVLVELFHIIAQHALQTAIEKIDEWQMDDSYFHQWQFRQAVSKGYFNPDFDVEAFKRGETDAGHDDIDWDRAYDDPEIVDYTEYDDQAKKFYNAVKYYTEVKDPTRIRELLEDEDPSMYGLDFDYLPVLIYDIIRRDLGRDIQLNMDVKIMKTDAFQKFLLYRRDKKRDVLGTAGPYTVYAI